MTATAASNNNAALADQYWTTGDEIHDTKANHDLPIEKIWTDRQFLSQIPHCTEMRMARSMTAVNDLQWN